MFIRYSAAGSPAPTAVKRGKIASRDTMIARTEQQVEAAIRRIMIGLDTGINAGANIRERLGIVRRSPQGSKCGDRSLDVAE